MGVSDVEFEIMTFISKLESLYPELDKEESRLRVHVQRFNIIRKFLIIIADRKIFALSVTGASPMRKATCLEAHKKHIFDKAFAEAIKHTRQLLDNYKASEEGDAAKLVIDEDIEADTQRLAELLYSPSAYFASRRSAVENAIDDFMADVDLKNAWDVRHPSDVRLLMTWLNGVEPSKNA